MAKSELHCELAERALVWLSTKATRRGIRGSVEVIIAEGYVPDSAAISGLQIQYEKQFKNCERQRGNSEECDDYIFIFESKVSRGDFFNTFKHGNHIGDRLKPIGDFHFVVTPKGLVKPEEVPTFWGLLEKSGSGLRLSKLPEYTPASRQQLHEVAYNILRCTHETKFNIFFELIDRYKREQIEIDL